MPHIVKIRSNQHHSPLAIHLRSRRHAGPRRTDTVRDADLLQPIQPGAERPQGFRARGRIICNRVNVGEDEIRAALATVGNVDPLVFLQQQLKCGTQCGSCVPELKKQVALASA